MTTNSAGSRQPVALIASVLLGAAWYFFAAVLAFVICMTAAFSFVGLPGGGNGEVSIPVSFTVDDAPPITSATLGVASARIRNISGTLIFPPQPGVSMIALGLFLIGTLGVVLWVMSELRAVLRTVRDGQAFVPANAGRVRRIAWVVILAEPVRALFVYSARSFAMKHFTAPGLHFDARVDFNLAVTLCGLIMLALAEVFRVGTQLDEDQSLTI